ncbi:MAG: FAD-binding oxidoreductase [Rhodospirillales bacterium]|nr:MAG: FAD-binding oxidoreductase [Rhodospirillales bacterium]
MADLDVAVIGGGLVGSAIAWGLAKAGQRVAVLDEGDIAFRASRGNFALVWVQSKGLGMPDYARWTRGSSDAWAGFASELRGETGIDVAHSRPGGFSLALSEAELERRATVLRRLHNQSDLPYEIMDRARLAKELPEIGPEVAGGAYCPLDGHVNSPRLLRALHTALTRRGVAYLPNRTVDRIERRDGGFVVHSGANPLAAARIVLAAGNGNRALGAMVGLDVPVRPQRGQIVVTEKAALFLRHPVVTIRQTDEGGVMMGDSLEEAGFDDTASTGVTANIADRAVRMFPLLGRLNVVRTWAALRVMTPDGFPIYMESVSHPGAFVATCHSGVTLAAAHALHLAPALARGALPDGFDAFHGRRFDVPAAS